MESSARVAELWRYPVKSMGGERVEQVAIGRRGLHADRLWAVRDLESEMTGTGRRLAGLLGCSARYVAEPPADAGPGNAPEVVITFPDGTERSSSDRALDDALSELLDRPVRLTPLPPVGDTREHRVPRWTQADIRRDLGIPDGEPMPDTSYLSLKRLLGLMRWATPPGSYVDLAPLHILSRASLEAMSMSAPDSVFDVRRFRPNVLVETDGGGQPEREWCGSRLRSRGAGGVWLHVDVPTVRCVVPTRAQPGLERDPGVMKTVAAQAERHLGVYVDVLGPGRLTVGDELSLEPVSAGPLTALARGASTRAKRLALRAGERVLP